MRKNLLDFSEISAILRENLHSVMHYQLQTMQKNNVRKSRVVLKDIAKQAGISPSTVSRILNNRYHRRRNSPTVARVLEIADSLGYVPRRSRNKFQFPGMTSIAVICSSHQSISNMMAIESVFRSIAVQRSLYPIPIVTNFISPVPNVIEEIQQFGISGAILAAYAPPLRELFSAWDPQVPAVLFNYGASGIAAFEDTGRNAVGASTNREFGSMLAVDHLVTLGHRRIAVFAIMEGTEKFTGYVKAMRDCGLPITDDLVIGTELWPEVPGPELGFQVATELLSAKDPPTAVICGNDEIAMALMTRLQQAGWRIPQDLSVVGWDGTYIGAHVFPPLTTVAQPFHEIAAHCVKLLSTWLNDGAAPPGGISYLQPSLVVRNSTGPAPRG